MTDPAINDGDGTDGRSGNQARDAMITVKDSILAIIQHEDDRGRDTSGLHAELHAIQDALSAAEVSGEYVRLAAQVGIDERVHDVFTSWVEASTKEGYFMPFPMELYDRLNGQVIEDSLPDGASCRSGCGSERPTGFPDEPNKPRVKDFARYVGQNPSGDGHLATAMLSAHMDRKPHSKKEGIRCPGVGSGTSLAGKNTRRR